MELKKKLVFIIVINKDDMKHGDWVFYDYEGRMMSIIQYYENKRVGTWMQYKEDGSILSIRKY